MRNYLLTLLVGIFVAAAACAPAADPNQPPDIRFGKDVCSACGMIISQPEFAAAYRTTDGAERMFDDVGEMFEFQAREGEQVEAYFVHDHVTKSWLRGEQGFYVVGSSLQTPMATGVAAFAAESDAKTLVDQSGGEVLTFQEAMERLSQRSPGGMSGH